MRTFDWYRRTKRESAEDEAYLEQRINACVHRLQYYAETGDSLSDSFHELFREARAEFGDRIQLVYRDELVPGSPEAEAVEAFDDGREYEQFSVRRIR